MRVVQAGASSDVVPPAQYIAAMRSMATGVTVVTSHGDQGRIGQTISAMCSVAADPPTALVCIKSTSPLVSAIGDSGVFAVNILAAGHAKLARVFSGTSPDGRGYDFACADWTSLVTGAPILIDCAAAVDCRVTETTSIGTHTVFYGEVVGSRRTAVESLTYRAGRYGWHVPLPDRKGTQSG